MSSSPNFDIDLNAFQHDPYPALAQMRANAPIAYVPQLDAVLLTRRDDIFVCEKNIEVFSSHQPDGLMNTLMGHNMMRKDGDAHLSERKMIFPSVSPKTVKSIWTQEFQKHADRILDDLEPEGTADLCKAYALPLSAECLKQITGLTNLTYNEMDEVSQAMIDGIANYVGDPAVEKRCLAATAKIDAAIDDMMPVLVKTPDHSLLSVMMQAGMVENSIRANIKLAISGGQNEPRDAISGAIWALLTHPEQLTAVRGEQMSWRQVFEEYARWISPIGMSPRRIAKRFDYEGVTFAPETRAFLMFSSANRDETHFDDPEIFNIKRNVSKSIAFGAGPHFCAGAWASRAMVADVALPSIFARLKNLRLQDGADVHIEGWAFRGILNLPCQWG